MNKQITIPFNKLTSIEDILNYHERNKDKIQDSLGVFDQWIDPVYFSGSKSYKKYLPCLTRLFLKAIERSANNKNKSELDVPVFIQDENCTVMFQQTEDGIYNISLQTNFFSAVLYDNHDLSGIKSISDLKPFSKRSSESFFYAPDYSEKESRMDSLLMSAVSEYSGLMELIKEDGSDKLDKGQELLKTTRCIKDLYIGISSELNAKLRREITLVASTNYFFTRYII